MQKKFRLKKNDDFKRLIDAKKFFVNKTFSIYYVPNTLGYARFGISVGKKHGNAVNRNKIKRQIRMMISQIFDYSTSCDYLIMIRKDYHKQTYAKNISEMEYLADKIDKRGVK